MLWVMYTTLDYTSILPERTLNRNTQNCRYPVKLPDNSWGGTRAAFGIKVTEDKSEVTFTPTAERCDGGHYQWFLLLYTHFQRGLT